MASVGVALPSSTFLAQRPVAHGRRPHRTRQNLAADKALAEACYLDVRNASPEQCDAVRRALQSGADPNTCDQYGSTVLMHEANWGHRWTVLLLLQYGASAGRADSEGNTALIHAMALPGQDPEIVAALVRHGARIRHRNKAGHDVLYYARENNQPRIRLLLRRLLRPSR